MRLSGKDGDPSCPDTSAPRSATMASPPTTGSSPPVGRPAARWRPSSARANARTPRDDPGPGPRPPHARARGERLAPISPTATTEANRRGVVLEIGRWDPTFLMLAALGIGGWDVRIGQRGEDTSG